MTPRNNEQRAPRCANGIATQNSSLRMIIEDPSLSFLMEAHDALSARIAAKSGFSGLWASGLTMASSLGYRDANEASWTEVVNIVARMAEVTTVPILVDGDSGFGNFNNARIVARALWRSGAAGVCLEDKAFPKMNSFVGDRHALADVTEFVGRLRAVKDTVADDAFVVVARIEALIAGWGQDEALRRAHAYADAGADAILIHSRGSTAEEVLSFARSWQNKRPVVLVPTKYHRTPTAHYREVGISTVIWANHGLRAATAALQRTCDRIAREESVTAIENEIASLDEVFELLNYNELAAAENRYLPPSPQTVA